MPHLKQEITIDLLCHVNYVRRNSMWYENMFIALENEKDEERAAQMSAWKHGDVRLCENSPQKKELRG